MPWGPFMSSASACRWAHSKRIISKVQACYSLLDLFTAPWRLCEPIPEVSFWIDSLCIYQDRYRSKYWRYLRFEPQFCEGVGFAHLTCQIRKFTLRIFIMEIYQYIAFYLHLTIPPSRRLARSSSQYGHVSLLTGQGSQSVSWSPKRL